MRRLVLPGKKLRQFVIDASVLLDFVNTEALATLELFIQTHGTVFVVGTTMGKDVKGLNVKSFSRLGIEIISPVLTFDDEERPPPPVEIPLPPIDQDQPTHTWTRRLMLPWFSHTRVAQYEPFTRELCNRLIDGFIDDGTADAAGDYARQIPVRVISLVLGVPDAPPK